ncbi:MAG: DUF134 domain-containing protein [Bacteroidetes bacterium]|nr:DUF134 domain-containing protein [Bacteroidota bacterium]
MSPRSRLLRKISNPPVIKGFKPYGLQPGTGKPEPVYLHYEEYEAIRLCDFEMCNHHRASVIMQVSRPTFTRIYATARSKIAKAFVTGSRIVIEGGKIFFDSDWYKCTGCNCNFNNPEKDKDILSCPLCGDTHIINYKPVTGAGANVLRQRCDYCICPSCGYEKPHDYGRPCSREICPECNTLMTRKGTPHSRNIIKKRML